MIISIFDSGTSFGHAVREYLLQKERAPKPRLMRGDINLIVDLIDSIHRKWKYTSGVLRFHKDDQPTAAQLEEIMNSFEEFMFAGKPRDRFELIWVEHLDKDDQELHFVIPRIDLETHQDLNIAPPGHADQHKVWAEKINTTYGFKNPLRARAKSKPKQEAHTRATKRAAIYAEMTQRYEAGEICSRTDLIAALNTVGTVRSKKLNTKFISVAFEGLENRIRFDGGIFARDFDFGQDRPSHSGRASRTMHDYDGARPKRKRALHRFEQPIADPFGDQDVYCEDIAERYEAAFAYRRARFEMIRARSRKLAKDADRPAPPKAVKRQRPTKEDPYAIERIRAARRRTRDRKSRLAELGRKATNTARACGRALTGLGNHLRRALEDCLKALKRRRDPAFFEEDQRHWQSHVFEAAMVAPWLTTLKETLDKIANPPDGQLGAVYLHKARKLIAKKPDLIARVESALGHAPAPYQGVISAAALGTIDAALHQAVEQVPKLQTNATTSTTRMPKDSNLRRSLGQ